MKKPTFSRITTVIILLFLGQHIFAQNVVPFSPRYDQAIKGDILLIGNSNVGIHPTDAYNGTQANDNLNAAVYVDIDGDASTFNSSSADLDVPSDESCYQIVYAGLYWSAVVNGDDPISDVKFKVPGGAYEDITGTEIYFQNATNNNNSNTYAYYHDVTDMLTALPNPEGTYAVANISSLVGPKPNAEGLSAGWSLFVVYEDPLLPSKYITSFDGFTKITSVINETFPISGFNTIPTGPVRAKFAFNTIEGDRRYTGDYLRLNGTTISATNSAGDVIRPGNNFFNSSVSDINPVTNTSELFTARNPNSSNTLGFDSGIINIPNPGNTIIANNATSANIRLGSNLDIYYYYFSAFAIEIIAPNIVLTKIVEDDLGNDIGNQIVGLGSPLNYVIGFQNTGNDDATNFQIRDILPINIIYNHPTDLVLPAGVTVTSYDPVTRELIFSIDNSVVEQNDPVLEIRIEAQVVDSCAQLADACSNIINNQAFASYQGTVNPDFTITDDPSLSSNTGCLISPQATNFLADLNDCIFEQSEILCGESLELTAANGYDTYAWSTSPTGVPVIGNTQTITVTETGTYYSYNTAIAPCQSIVQEYEIALFGGDIPNPVIPYADEVVTCPNDGKLLPNIFLCGANDSRLIETNISDSISIIWEQLDESSCAAVTDEDCANEDSGCTWNEVGNGSNFLADTSGQYRLTINYPGGCFNQFYFNIYENILDASVVASDIICTSNGSITVNGVPSGYEYSVDGTNYQSSNIFTINTAGIYTIYIRQIGVDTNPCVFTVPDVQIRDREFTATNTVTQPLCYGDKGSIHLASNDVDPQYTFELSESGTLVNSVGPITGNNYTFENLNPGTYTATLTTENGCFFTEDITIVEPPLLTATAAITAPLTCEDGEITVYPIGGTPPYFYFVNSTTVFQSTPEIVVTTAGIYDITVVDSNNCSTSVTISIDSLPEPDFTIDTTDILCGGSGDTGIITINITNSNGSSIAYSIDGGTSFLSSNTFTGLAAGDYNVIVQYTSGPSICLTDPQTVTITANDAISGTAELTASLTCLNDGTITVTGVTGGDSPYSYSIDGTTFQPSNTFTGLTQGTYSITISDANVCTFITNEITIAALNPPTDLGFSNTAITCPTNTSTVTLSTTGGFGTLEYQIIAPAGDATTYQASNIFSNLLPGTYTFQVQDENDCVYSESFTINPIPSPTLNAVLTEDLDCTVTPDAIITGAITGPTPYTYAVSINGGTYTSLGATGTPFTYSTATSGDYQFEITDANGCTAESSVIIVNPISLPELSLVAVNQSIQCNGDSNGSLDITIDNTVGTPPFTINVNNDTTATDYGTQTAGLPAGTYTITLTDSKSCTATETIVISEPDAIAFDLSKIDITCSDPGGSSLGSISVENITGGTAPFTYFISNNFGDVIPGNPYSAASNENHTFNIIDFGTYTVNVIDANGCSVSQQVVIASPPSDLLIDVGISVPDCTSGGTASVTAVSAVGSGNYEFGILEFNSIPYTSTYLMPDTVGGDTRTFTNLIPGVLYTFVVHDLTTNCYYVKSADAPIIAASTLTSNVVPNNVVCQGENNGSVTFTIDNFDSTTNSVDYTIYKAFDNALINGPTNIAVTFGVPTTVTTPNPGTLSPGQYYIVFTENGSGAFNGCRSASTIFEITESLISLDLAVSLDQNANCNTNSGVVSVIGQNGTAPYEYQITTTPASPLATDAAWATLSVFNVDAGSYYVHVLDANGCVVSSPITAVPMDPTPVISALVNNQCTVTEGNFEIDVTLDTTGIAPYSFSIDGGAFQTQTAPFTISNLFSGTHTIEIQDANGCGNIVSVDIEAPLNLTPEVTVMPSCNNDDGEITITTTGGSGTYTYTMTPNPASISISGNVLSGIPSGLYTITVTDTVTFCSEDVIVNVPEATLPTFILSSTSVTCFGDNTGTFDINITNYTGAYTYQVFDNLGNAVSGIINANTSTNPETVTGMSAGTFSVLITETAVPFCSNTENIVITSPIEALTLTLSETSNVTCNNNQGTITAIATGGWGDYEYELTGDANIAYSANSSFIELSAGTYTVNTRDAKGCITSETITLDEPTPISATFTPNTNVLSCFGDQDASITVTNVTGGQGSNYIYTLNTILPTPSSSGPQASNTFSNLGPGTYNITITDGFDCEFTSINIVITEPTPIVASLARTTTQTCLTESTLTLSASGGTGTYTYSDTAAFTNILGSFNTSTSFSVPVGTYTYYVRDSNGCIANVSNDITVDPLPDLTIILEASNITINCAGDNNGSILANAQGGLGNYTYSLQDNLGNTLTAVQSSPGYFTELIAGTYVVVVESGDCIETSTPINITEPSAPLDATLDISNVTCSGNDNGSLEITASGGTGLIKYAISPQLNQFFDSNIFENLEPADYQVIVQDELGCFLTFDVTISEPTPVILSIVANSIFPEVCEGDSNGEFSIDISGGNLPYSVSIDDIDGVYITGNATQTEFEFTDLNGGDHVVFIRDAEGCESQWNITFPEAVRIEPLVEIEYACDNNTQGNIVTVTVDDSITDLSDLDYSLDGGPYQANNKFINVPVGIGHYIDVRHTNGCIQTTDTFEIESYDPITLTFTEGELNEFIANASGGNGNYQYTMNGEDYGDINNYIITESGVFTVTVTDESGCFATAQIELEFIEICIPNWFTPNGDGEFDTWSPGCTENYPNLTFDIFDRYGRKVATYTVGQTWDGRYNGTELPTGDYWYVVKTNDSNVDKEFVGHFTLYR